MDTDDLAEFRLNIAALELCSKRVQAAYEGDDISAAAVEANFGLHAVYDLHEALFRELDVRNMAEQDDYLDQNGGQVVGALSLARGARTHHLVRFVRPGGFGDLPYGMGPFAGGWVWRGHSWSSPKFARRALWWRDQVQWRYLHNPLDEAWGFFVEHPVNREA